MRKFLLRALFFWIPHHTHAAVFGAFAALALLLTGCSTAAEELASHGPRCDYQGPSGICVYADRNAKSFNLAALESVYMQAKREVEMRYGLDLKDVSGPVVRVMNFAHFARLHPVRNRVDGYTEGHHGWTSFDSGEIRLTGPAVMRHEAFHYLLWKAGYPNQLNSLHEHPAFDEYRDGQWLPKPASAVAPTPAKPQANPF